MTRSTSASASFSARIKGAQRKKEYASFLRLMRFPLVTKHLESAMPKLNVTAMYPFALPIISALEMGDFAMERECLSLKIPST